MNTHFIHTYTYSYKYIHRCTYIRAYTNLNTYTHDTHTHVIYIYSYINTFHTHTRLIVPRRWRVNFIQRFVTFFLVPVLRSRLPTPGLVESSAPIVRPPIKEVEEGDGLVWRMTSNFEKWMQMLMPSGNNFYFNIYWLFHWSNNVPWEEMCVVCVHMFICVMLCAHCICVLRTVRTTNLCVRVFLRVAFVRVRMC